VEASRHQPAGPWQQDPPLATWLLQVQQECCPSLAQEQLQQLEDLWLLIGGRLTARQEQQQQQLVVVVVVVVVCTWTGYSCP
jgi:hypothetical protein